MLTPQPLAISSGVSWHTHHRDWGCLWWGRTPARWDSERKLPASCWGGTAKLFWVSCRRGVAFLLHSRHQQLLLCCSQPSRACWGNSTIIYSPPWQRGTRCFPGRENSVFFVIFLPCSLPSTSYCFGEQCFGPPFPPGVVLLESHNLGPDSKFMHTYNSGETQALKKILNIVQESSVLKFTECTWF